MVAAIAQTVGITGLYSVTMAAYTPGSRLLASVNFRGSNHVTRTGWTHLGDLNGNGYTDGLCMLWAPSAGESTSLAFTAGGGSNRCWVTEITGVGDPVQSATATSTTCRGFDLADTITGVRAGSMLVCSAIGAAADVWGGSGWTPTSGWTEIEDTPTGQHPYSFGEYQVASAGGSYSSQPVHAIDWNGWFPRGMDMRIVEFPVAAARSRAFIL